MINIDELIKVSLVKKDNIALKVYRNLKSDIINFKTQKNAPVYDEMAEIKLIQKYVSKLEDAKIQFQEAGRMDLVESYESELKILKPLLPEPVNEESIQNYIKQTSDHMGWSQLDGSIIIPKKDMGNVIKTLKNKFLGADGKMISDIVKQYVA